MNLADFFSEDFKSKHFSAIDLGSAVLVEMPEFGIRHPKFAIFFANDIFTEGFCGLVIINSEINENINRSEYLKSQHVLIDSARHPFLQYDSYIDCTQIHNRYLQDIIDLIVREPTRLVGNVCADILLNVHGKLVESSLISKRDKRKYALLK